MQEPRTVEVKKTPACVIEVSKCGLFLLVATCSWTVLWCCPITTDTPKASEAVPPGAPRCRGQRVLNFAQQINGDESSVLEVLNSAANNQPSLDSYHNNTPTARIFRFAVHPNQLIRFSRRPCSVVLLCLPALFEHRKQQVRQRRFAELSLCASLRASH